ncbi:MAG: diacylglycerol O-acyltransferase / wax synthase [Solirubrobacteraceae bacterium]|nr:diacylglycerol O-acyltransferase / wax synthase [Solirubrobacteraceae bacterium]
MRQLTSLDTQFLAIEDGKTHGHVTALGIYDPSTAEDGVLTLDAIRDLVAARLHLLPPFRWRLAEVPFGLDHPYWFDDPEFDLEFHVRELALPAPGDERMLTEQVARIVARPLDRARPLWELYLIHGLADGRVAVLTKMHHAAVDGMSGAEVLSVLLDPSPTPRTFTRPAGAPVVRDKPGQLALFGRAVAGLPANRVRSLRSLPGLLPHLDQVATMRSLPGVSTIAALSRRAERVRTRDGGVLEGRRLHAPRTSLNAPIGPHRRIALSRQSLAEVKQIKEHFGVTVNDVVVAICAGALRSWLEQRGELPEAPLLAMIPVSVRTPAEQGTFGNRVATMLTQIPTDVADPAARLTAAHEAMRSAKERHKAVPASVLQDANDVIPPALFARAARVTTSVAARHPSEAPVNTVISNVPGSPVPLYLAGARLEALYPVSAILHGVGLNITVMSYCGGLDFGIVVDRDMVDDAGPIAAALARAQAELLSLVHQTEPIVSCR